MSEQVIKFDSMSSVANWIVDEAEPVMRELQDSLPGDYTLGWLCGFIFGGAFMTDQVLMGCLSGDALRKKIKEEFYDDLMDRCLS